MRAGVLVAGAALILAGLLAAIIAHVTLADLTAAHNTVCGLPTDVSPTEACKAVENTVHAWQAVGFLGTVAAFAGGGLLLAEYYISRSPPSHFDRRIPAFRLKEIRQRRRHQGRHAAR